MDEGPECETGNHQNPKGKDLSDLSCSNLLLDTSPKAREFKAKMNFWDLMKIKSPELQRKQSTRLKATDGLGKDICK